MQVGRCGNPAWVGLPTAGTGAVGAKVFLAAIAEPDAEFLRDLVFFGFRERGVKG
jgi:hypothetical protein